jgi:Flp pilus assembly pilin Flp
MTHQEQTQKSGLLLRLWRDEAGSLLSTEYILLGTLLTLGLIVGIHAARNSILTELEDYAAAILGIECGGLDSSGMNDMGAGGTGVVTFAGNDGGVVP